MAEEVAELAFDYQDSGTSERGCGKRVPGALYAVTPIGGYGGDPWWTTLLDPPEPVTPSMMRTLGIAPRDVSLRTFELEGVTHYYLLDWVGAGDGPQGTGYWNPADMIEEGISGKGFSGRVPVDKIDWSKVDLRDGSKTQSKRWLIHPHAYVLNPKPLWKERLWDRYRGLCITQQDPHNVRPDPGTFCDSLWWETIEGGLPFSAEPTDRRVIRTIGSLSYPAWRAPDGFVPAYHPGIFMKLPFRLEIIIDGSNEREHEKVAAKLDALHQAYQFAEE